MMHGARIWFGLVAIAFAVAAGGAHADDGFRRVHGFGNGLPSGIEGGYYPGPAVFHQAGAGAQAGALFGVTTAGGLVPPAPACTDPNGCDPHQDRRPCGSVGCGVVYKLVPPPPGGEHWVETRLYLFHGGTDGYAPGGGNLPAGPLVFDAAGAAYGTTEFGGAHGAGTVFRLTPPGPTQYFWNKTTLHSFTGNAPDGGYPIDGVVVGAAGVVYGSAGPSVFSLTPPTQGQTAWRFAILHSFSTAEGGFTNAGLLLDPSGAIFGSTANGGDAGKGTIFRLTRPLSGTIWDLVQIYGFNDPCDVHSPSAALVRDPAGVLYGTTVEGGRAEGGLRCGGKGTVFSLKPPSAGHSAWTYALLHNFTGTDGALPMGALLRDSSGALYGSTFTGDHFVNGVRASHNGLIYRLTPPTSGGAAGWTETVLHISVDGQTPNGWLIRDDTGTLFGTTYPGEAFEVLPPSSP